MTADPRKRLVAAAVTAGLMALNRPMGDGHAGRAAL
jgi:hypothetical protein